jgi:putative Mg2+ transporter-C (MgtC) family protein
MALMNPSFFQAILLSLLLGSAIGLERQWHRRLVDLKTNALVSLGSCLFILVTQNGEEFQDYVRMAGQIVVGVGFIGGGLLFRDGTLTKGINTAATLWCCAAVGILCGIHRWVEASVATFTIVSANTVLRQIAQYLNLKMGANDSLSESVLIHLRCQQSDVSAIQQYIGKYFDAHHLELKAATSEQLDGDRVQLSFTVLFEHGQYSHAGTSMLQNLNPPGAVNLSWAVN